MLMQDVIDQLPAHCKDWLKTTYTEHFKDHSSTNEAFVCILSNLIENQIPVDQRTDPNCKPMTASQRASITKRSMEAKEFSRAQREAREKFRAEGLKGRAQGNAMKKWEEEHLNPKSLAQDLDDEIPFQ